MDNPYQSPASRIDVPPSTGLKLATRGSRLGGSLIDRFILWAILFPFEYATGYFQASVNAAKTHTLPPLGQSLMWSGIGLVVFVIVQGYPLVKDGQTWGKKMVHTKIVTMDAGAPSVGQICARYAIINGIAIIPFVRMGLLVDALMIFRDDRRCAHDIAAGTQVIDVFEEPDRPGPGAQDHEALH